MAVEKLAEAAADPRNHRYSASRGIPNLRAAVCELYARRFGIELDPDREAITTLGAKEGLTHLMWLLVEPGDAALVPDPSYPIHRFAPVLAGADVEGFRLDEDLVVSLADAHRRTVGLCGNETTSVVARPTVRRCASASEATRSSSSRKPSTSAPARTGAKRWIG